MKSSIEIQKKMETEFFGCCLFHSKIQFWTDSTEPSLQPKINQPIDPLTQIANRIFMFLTLANSRLVTPKKPRRNPSRATVHHILQRFPRRQNPPPSSNQYRKQLVNWESIFVGARDMNPKTCRRQQKGFGWQISPISNLLITADPLLCVGMTHVSWWSPSSGKDSPSWNRYFLRRETSHILSRMW